MIFTRKLITDCLLGLSLLLAILTTLNFLQTLKIQKSPMKKFHFRHQKIIHHYIKHRKSLENDELPNTKKNIFNGLIKTIYGCIDDENAFLELENDKTINDLNLENLLGQLKTQAFPLSDIITNAINQKEGVALDYALINDIKYNLLDNTFHFIFDIDLHLIDD